jgi:hypothetical protein
MPGRWEPWPVRSQARRPGATVSVTTSPVVLPSASERRAASAPSRSVARTAARLGSIARVVARERPRSTSVASGASSIRQARRPALSASASGDRAERTSGTGVETAGASEDPAERRSGTGPGAARPTPASASTGAEVEPPTAEPSSASFATDATTGASSTITWALVPEMPKEETPARRVRLPLGQGVASASSSTSPASQSTFEDGASTWRDAGNSSCRRASTTLITPATPAAAWVWPMLDLTEPSSNGPRSPRSAP